MSNTIQHFDFYKSTLEQLSAEIKILQKEQIDCTNKSASNSHNNVFDKVSEEIKILHNM